MRRFGLRPKSLLLAILALAWCQAPARAGLDVTVFSSVAPVSGGLFQYTYMVMDNADSTAPVSSFEVAVNDPYGLIAITTPVGLDFFNTYTPGDSFISFFDVTDGGIVAGTSAIFSFESSSGPGIVGDSTGGFDSSGNSLQSLGMVMGAAVVPEPSSLLMCGIGAIGVVGLLIRRRRTA